MKKGIIFSFLFGFFFLISNGQETGRSVERKNALGVRISGEDAAINHSITYKYFFNPSLAVEGLFTITDPLAIGVLVEKHKPFGPSGLSWFTGAGAYISLSSSRKFGVQGVVGLDLLFPSLPINLSVDWKPELNITKDFSFEPSAFGFSARFAF